MVPLLPIQVQTSTLRKVLKRLHYPLDVMLVCVRWYAAYPLSLRNLEEMMAERGGIGTRRRNQTPPPQTSVHPHARGEHASSLSRVSTCSGSSPRTWGTLWMEEAKSEA